MEVGGLAASKKIPFFTILALFQGHSDLGSSSRSFIFSLPKDLTTDYHHVKLWCFNVKSFQEKPLYVVRIGNFGVFWTCFWCNMTLTLTFRPLWFIFTLSSSLECTKYWNMIILTVIWSEQFSSIYVRLNIPKKWGGHYLEPSREKTSAATPIFYFIINLGNELRTT